MCRPIDPREINSQIGARLVFIPRRHEFLDAQKRLTVLDYLLELFVRHLLARQSRLRPIPRNGPVPLHDLHALFVFWVSISETPEVHGDDPVRDPVEVVRGQLINSGP